MAALALPPRALPWATLMVGVLLGGCIDLFRPAQPEPPAQGSGGIDPDYSSHENTLATLALGIAAKGQGNGRTAYIRAFADPVGDQVSFSLTFDPDVARRFENAVGQLPGWNLEYEKNFYSRFLGVSSHGYYMRWEPYVPAGSDNITSTEVLLHRKYTVYTVDAQNNALGVIAIGLADLTLRRVAPSRWAILRWEDRVDPAEGVDPTNTDHLSFSARRLESLSAP